MSVGLVKPKISPPGTWGVPLGGSTLAQRSATLAGLTGALRRKSAAMTGIVKHAINAAEMTVLAANRPGLQSDTRTDAPRLFCHGCPGPIDWIRIGVWQAARRARSAWIAGLRPAIAIASHPRHGQIN